MCIGTQSPESHNIMSDCQLQLHIYYINVVTNIMWIGYETGLIISSCIRTEIDFKQMRGKDEGKLTYHKDENNKMDNENIVIKEEELMMGFVICVWRISLVLMLSRHIKNICINNSFVLIVLWLKVLPANYAQAIKSVW